MNETTVEAVVKAMKTVATSVLKVDDAYKSQMAQSVRILADVLEQATRETKTVEQVVEKKEETVAVETPVVEEPTVETKKEEPVVETPVVDTKKEEHVELVRTKDWNPAYKWVAKDVVKDELIGKPELKTGELDAVDTVLTQETMASIFGANKTLEVHFQRGGGKQGRKQYCVEHTVDIPVEDLMTRKWTRKRISNVHKEWYQQYTTTSGIFGVVIDMHKDGKIKVGVVGSYEPWLVRKSDGKVVAGSLIDGYSYGYDEKKYDQRIVKGQDFATMCGVQTVWDARNVA